MYLPVPYPNHSQRRITWAEHSAWITSWKSKKKKQSLTHSSHNATPQKQIKRSQPVSKSSQKNTRFRANSKWFEFQLAKKLNSTKVEFNFAVCPDCMRRPLSNKNTLNFFWGTSIFLIWLNTSNYQSVIVGISFSTQGTHILFFWFQFVFVLRCLTTLLK